MSLNPNNPDTPDKPDKLSANCAPRCLDRGNQTDPTLRNPVLDNDDNYEIQLGLADNIEFKDGGGGDPVEQTEEMKRARQQRLEILGIAPVSCFDDNDSQLFIHLPYSLNFSCSPFLCTPNLSNEDIAALH